jgi:hypothetical protein
MSVIPGTFEPGFVEQRIIERAVPQPLRVLNPHSRGLKVFDMGECSIMKARESAGVNLESLWHLSISCRDRHPTWDEIKTARYRLLDPTLCFGMLLPPPEFYINVPAQDHVFHLWEVTDPREPWTAR